jgi:carbon-monoxide dehydrogenase small subunit
MNRRRITLVVNGRTHEVWADANRALVDALHDDLGMPDVRYGCGEGVCGTCTVLLDGEPVSACLVLAVQAQDREITTVTGLPGGADAQHPLQQCLLRHGAVQCGFCTPGVILTSVAMVEGGGSCRRPTRDEIRYELVGNLCRCTGYTAILDAVEDYADQVTSADEPAGTR